MHAAKIAPKTPAAATTTTVTATTRPRPALGTATGTATVYRPAPTPAEVIDAWARHVGASNGFGEAVTGNTSATYVLPYWKSR